MVNGIIPKLDCELDGFVAAFEAACAGHDRAALDVFLPDPAHPLYRDVLRELVRVDLEYGWEQGRSRGLADYRGRFPQLFERPDDVRAIAFEEYRLRRQAGQDPDPEEYRRAFGVDTKGWPTHRLAPRRTAVDQGRGGPAFLTPGPPGAGAPALPPDGLPAIGTDFLGFHLLAVLGRGAFGQVYLARQGELADRPVALKVSREVGHESRSLARLQHTNIVPIHSVHHADPFHAVCMPYLGSGTLADLLRTFDQRGIPASGKDLADTFRACRSITRPDGPSPVGLPDGPAAAVPPQPRPAVAGWKALEGRTYVEAVLWMGGRLADGLAHAHERGILHRDLKPANVLLADDGQPMLLDFNLAEETDRTPDGPRAFVGGTLPYMAPETLAAARDHTAGADARGDIYALGVILYELLTGRHPFPVHGGPLPEVLARMQEDRSRPPPSPRALNPAVSPAAAAVVGRCLEADPARRYQTARQLQQDLERHLADLPLRHTREPSLRERGRKWARRHPRLTSATGVGCLAATLLLALGFLFLLRGERLARMEAAETFRQFRADVRQAQVLFLDAPSGQVRPEVIAAACRRALDRYHVLDGPGWREGSPFRALDPEHQDRVGTDAGELLLLLAGLTHLRADPEAGRARRDADLQTALDLNRRAESCYPGGQAPGAVWHQRALFAEELGRPDEAGHWRQRARATPPHTPRDCCMLACTLMARGHFRQALPLWQKAALQDPQNVWAWYGLGACYDALGRPGQAAASYSGCIALAPEFGAWYVKRGLAQLRQKEYLPACADFDEALRRQPGRADIHVNRALARLGADRCGEAVQDLTRALELGATGPRPYLLRARARERAGDREGAGRDRAAALRREPDDEAAWLARGTTRVATAPEGALADFDRALRHNPRSLPALENKAHVLAERLGRTDEAVRVLDRALKWYPEHAPAHASRGVLLARLGRREAALQDARAALSLDDSPATRYQVAGIYALTSRQHGPDRRSAFALLKAALQQGYGHDLVPADGDLAPLRSEPAFRQLLEAVRALRQGQADTNPAAGSARADGRSK